MSWGDLLSNPLFAGGAALGLMAALGAGLRKVAAQVWKKGTAHFMGEAEVVDEQAALWVRLWLSSIKYGQRCRMVIASIEYKDGEPALLLEPGRGIHFFLYERRPCLLWRYREQLNPNARPQEAYLLRVLGGPEILRQLLTEAKDEALQQLGRLNLAWSNVGPHWEWVRIGAPRPLDSVVLPGELCEELREQAVRFFQSQGRYASRGTPWRLTWSLSGPAGTGKSSLPRALAHNLGAPFYVLNLTSPELTDSQLIQLLSKVPVGAVLLIDEVDKQIAATAKSNKVTLAGLRSAMDGPLSPEGRLMILTTNEPEDLDPALRRPGRVDREVYLGLANRDQARRLFLRFFPGHDAEAAAFADQAPDEELSPAEIQQYLQSHETAFSAAREAWQLAAAKKERAA